MLMVTSPHVPHGHALATAAKDTRFSCHQVQSSSVQSKGHVHTNCMSCEPLRMLPQDAQESGSRSCLQERGTPPCPHHSRENEVEMFNSLAKSFQSSTSQSSLESDSSPPTVSNFVPSLSSSPHSSLFYSSSTSDTSRSVYSSSSGFQLSASRSFMSGSTAVESSSTLPTPPSSLLVPLNTFHYTQSNIPLPHACSNELLSASPPPLRRAAAVFATPARAFPGLSDASVQAQSVRLIAESHPVPHRPPAIFSCSFLDTRTSKKLSLNSLTLSRLSPKLAAASEPLLSSHNAPQRSPTITPLSSQQSFFITSASISEHQDSSEEKYSTLASSCRALDPFFPTSVVSSGSVPSSAPPSLPLTRKTQVFSATSDLGSGRRHRRRRHTSLPEGGEEQ
ncbi:uncharacterized protein LOC126994695 [Eriocheir sinensis]|uniref:uncharacterized protein LOC126994695 n=1 Tax=Eriocheir sinensis TaxID=95602 RepID=UPI0021C9CDD0|nr:uncharacterized protein LOC126994695 [Eriocheir sinensis]